MFKYNNFSRFKIISFKDGIFPSRYSDTSVIKEPSRRIDSILESIFITGAIPDVFPEELQVDLTRACSYKHVVNSFLQGIKLKRKPLKDCLNCSFPQQDLMPEIPLSKFRSIIEIFSSFGGRQVFLTGGGEPGNYPDFVGALEIVSEKGLEFGFNTNGTAVILLNRESDERLIRLYRHSSSEHPQYVSVSVHDLEDTSIFEEMLRLSERLHMLGLNVHLRTSFLVHPDTTEEEARDFLFKSRAFGAGVASFKPAYYFDHTKGYRLFLRNQRIYESVRNLIELYNSPSFRVNGPRMDRISSDFGLQDFPVCFAPLEKVYVNVFGQVAMCCDRKDLSQGGIPSAVISDDFPSNPSSYYKKALKWMLLFRDWRNCVQGCNQYEFNLHSYKFLESSEIFVRYMGLLEQPENEIEDTLRSVYLF